MANNCTNLNKAHHSGHPRHHEVTHHSSCPANATIPSLPPDADILVLIGQMLATSKVEGLDSASVGPKEVLVAAVGSKVLIITTVLSDLDVPVPSG